VDLRPLPPPALAVVVSGPSGVGKTVVCERLIAAEPNLTRSVSATTRPARSGESEGRDYWFRDQEAFHRGVAAGEFLEWATVYGHLYGTPVAAVDRLLAAGRSVLFNIDVQGGLAIKKRRPEAVLVFLAPPDLEVLEQRLRGRKTDGPDAIERRLATARQELSVWPDYDYLVVNRDLTETVETLRAVLRAEEARTSRRLPRTPD
jgi:guanylate kinase